ncbi:pyrroline-5-carboxylate reductase [Steroidobacter sp. S1-65]|uniref:Pyrroline-5-carboxylate reductase n=1 Tax=Steroidobacter gossypii TaxID=2805490 RepID=A0ABS1X330_9GAMM|nr:pyrroline-5-carboxylate reductase [Steroidobacter gossypii]MBM0107607.1 pyrroline-5-carboxylate reductase [Steroidobacter gossypii]
MKQRIAFIGGGNMGRSLIGGLIAKGTDPARIVVADPYAPTLQSLQADYQVQTVSNNADAVRNADVVLLAVKPQTLRDVVTSLQEQILGTRPLLISIAAGILAADIQRWAGGVQVVRCMPNRPALQGCGVTALYANEQVTEANRSISEQILGAVGATLWVEREADMDTVTAISGSGPAYFFLLIEMLEAAGESMGLSAAVARKLAIETAYGSGFMARESSDSPATLRQQVTSKGGTTEAALKHLEASNVRAIFSQAVAAAAQRSAQLAKELGSA